jgi:hypothetical protein
VQEVWQQVRSAARGEGRPFPPEPESVTGIVSVRRALDIAESWARELTKDKKVEGEDDEAYHGVLSPGVQQIWSKCFSSLKQLDAAMARYPGAISTRPGKNHHGSPHPRRRDIHVGQLVKFIDAVGRAKSKAGVTATDPRQWPAQVWATVEEIVEERRAQAELDMQAEKDRIRQGNMRRKAAGK